MGDSIRSVVACFNGSDESRDALALAEQLARSERAGLHVAVVHFDDNLDVEAKRFETLFAEARTALGAFPFAEQRLSDVSAPFALHQLAERIEPEVMVVGSTHRGTLGNVLPGSVGERLLHGSPCPVAIAPRGYAGREHYGAGVIGVAYDGSDESRAALTWSARLAAELGSSLRLIRVIPKFVTPRADGRPDASHIRMVHADIEKELKAVAAALSGVEVTSVIEDGNVADELAEQAVELDLLVMGSRGYGAVRRVLLGGVSSAVMRTAPCPVVITPRSSVSSGAPAAAS